MKCESRWGDCLFVGHGANRSLPFDRTWPGDVFAEYAVVRSVACLSLVQQLRR
jgi:hypothetical protein